MRSCINTYRHLSDAQIVLLLQLANRSFRGFLIGAICSYNQQRSKGNQPAINSWL